MLDTGDWMTPREIPHDFAFLEKPPLKFWLVAAPIRLGLLPRTEAGFRAVVALLGAIAFGYVALLAYRLAGPAARARLTIIRMRDLVLQHGAHKQHGVPLSPPTPAASTFLCGGTAAGAGRPDHGACHVAS